ncbi:MAG: hypothetical protein EON95_13780 [Caulobacteraceae bacterium]|nr:MAG: hypothetical protein EON95_13780 [Caulobacteraceae bacterium]
MGEHHNDPIISGPEPSGPVVWWRNLVSAVNALRARRRRPTTAPRERSRRETGAVPAPKAVNGGAELKAWRAVHGPPFIWLAPVFLVFAALYALPQLAEALQPQAPRSMIKALVALGPDFAAPIEPMLAGWLWAPLWLTLLSLAFRLRAVWVTHLAVLDAVGWSMAALVVDGAAWLLLGREVLAGWSPAERDGVWQLMVGETVFLFLTAVLFGPTSRQRIPFEQG